MTDLPPLIVDDRAGSGELHLELCALGLPAKIQRLEAGDFSFVGEGRGHKPARIGVERKRLSDVLASVTDGRFAGEQLPKMVAAYDAVWLLVDDIWRCSSDGTIEVYGRGKWGPTYGKRWMYRELEAWMLTMTVKAGVHVRCVSGAGASARFIATLYNWWNLAGGYEGHAAHKAVHSLTEGRELLTQVGLTAATLPTIGAEKAVYVQERFPTIWAMVHGGLREWAGIGWTSSKGRKMRLGPASAMAVRAAIRGEEE